ncbi:MAG: nitrous oxide-stimulated promoter family protein [Dehalococcoidales bacterium]
MTELFDRLDSKKSKDIKVLGNFISIFCRENHGEAERDELPIKDARIRNILGEEDLVLCTDCQKLISHGIAKLMQCPYDPKPMCKKCETHCYAPGYREKIREVMKFSGLYLVKHGRVDLMVHYFF